VADSEGAVRPCPACRKPVRWAGNPDRPFCSERCRVADLGDWAAERYRVPGEPVPEDDDTGGNAGH
jgi:endogenous inhibitor of DNA gyrase (YacG/DUF329 family)